MRPTQCFQIRLGIHAALAMTFIFVPEAVGQDRRTDAPEDELAKRARELDVPVPDLDAFLRGDDIERAICVGVGDGNDLRDVGCYKAKLLCANQPQYAAGTPVARLKFVYKNAAGKVFLRSGTGFLFEPPAPHAARRDLLLTAKHVIEFPVGSMVLFAQAEFLAEYKTAGGALCPCGQPAGPYPAGCGLAAPNCQFPGTPCAGTRVKIGCWQPAPDACDWAVIKVGAGVPAAVTGAPALLGTGTATNDDVYIVQHPQGRCKEIAAKKVGTVSLPPDCWFEHNVDTQPGSSGAPVFKVSDNKVVGVHYGATPGTPPACPNKAVRISWLLDVPIGDTVSRLVKVIDDLLAGTWTEIDLLPDGKSSKRYACSGGPTSEADGNECPEDVQDIPAVSEWGLATLLLLVLAAGTLALRRSAAMSA